MNEQILLKKARLELKGCSLFSVLNDGELEKLAALGIEKLYEPGAVIFNEGDTAQDLIVIQEGRVVVQMTLPVAVASQLGRRITVDIVGEQEVLGWSAVVEPYIYTLTAVCLQKVRVLAINGSGLRDLLRNEANIGYQVLRGLTGVVASRLEDTRQVLVSERLWAGSNLESEGRVRALKR